MGHLDYIWWVRDQACMKRLRLSWPDLGEKIGKSGLVEGMDVVQKGPFDSCM